MPETLIQNLILTELIELSVAYLLRVRQTSDLTTLGLINIITNLPLNFYLCILMLTGVASPILWTTLITLEISIVAIEAFFIKHFLCYNRLKPLTLSLILNATSFSIGIIIGGIKLWNS